MKQGNAVRDARVLTRVIEVVPPRHEDPRPSGVAPPARVVVVAAERLFREALSELLHRADGIEVVGQVTGAAVVNVVAQNRPDVVLVDITTPELDYLDLLHTMKRRCPDARPLMVTGAMDDSTLIAALKAGARGYVSKEASPVDVSRAIRGVARGEFWIERRLIAAMLDGHVGSTPALLPPGRPAGLLTAREEQILRCLASGGTNRDIAETLHISEKTVKAHLNSIFRKLNLTRRLQAVLYAVRQGLR